MSIVNCKFKLISFDELYLRTHPKNTNTNIKIRMIYPDAIPFKIRFQKCSSRLIPDLF